MKIAAAVVGLPQPHCWSTGPASNMFACIRRTRAPAKLEPKGFKSSFNRAAAGPVTGYQGDDRGTIDSRPPKRPVHHRPEPYKRHVRAGTHSHTGGRLFWHCAVNVCHPLDDRFPGLRRHMAAASAAAAAELRLRRCAFVLIGCRIATRRPIKRITAVVGTQSGRKQR